MIYLKTEEELQKIKASSLLVSETLALMASLLKPGITGKQLDVQAYEFIRSQGAKPSFLGYNGFPATLCISKNEEVVHGIPNDQPFKDGDIVSVDCGVFFNGFHGDSAYTFVLGQPDDDVVRLMKVTQECLYLGIAAAKEGNRIGDISYAVQYHAEQKHQFGVVRELVGHGIGRSLHEPPEVPNFGKSGRGVLLKQGMTLAIEPMINLGTKNVKHLKDGWTVVTADRKPSAHYEHTIAVGKEGAILLSDHSKIEEKVKNNTNLYAV